MPPSWLTTANMLKAQNHHCHPRMLSLFTPSLAPTAPFACPSGPNDQTITLPVNDLSVANPALLNWSLYDWLLFGTVMKNASRHRSSPLRSSVIMYGFPHGSRRT